MLPHCQFAAVVVVLVTTQWSPVTPLTHMPTLMWTQKNTYFGPVSIVGLLGKPETWLESGSAQMIGQGAPVDLVTRLASHRIALGYRYSSQNLFWSDRGLKNIFKVRLEEMNGQANYTYTAPLKKVYRGISSQVNGLAVDWLSGSIYWTDALYNWVTIASSNSTDVYRHLIITGLDKPMGIAVHPMKGWLFWSDWGSIPKIERSNLAGTNKRTLVNTALSKPMGMAVDYHEEHLYWVDDFLDTIEKMDFNGRHRITIRMHQGSTHGLSQLFGIALSEHYIFVTDQMDRSLKVFNKVNHTMTNQVNLSAVPYDILMYDGNHQQRITSDCTTMGCQHLCISTGLVNEDHVGGQCLCKQGYDLNADERTCTENGRLLQPAYVYSVGHSLCKTPINLPDRDVQIQQDVDCFLSVNQVLALAYDANAELIFYSDEADKDIKRHRQVETEDWTTLTVQTGHVRGMSVDWIASNVYWTDEEYNHIMMTRIDGRYPTIVNKNLGQPAGIAVNPASGKMYWAARSTDSIMESNMDGSGIRIFASQTINPDGLELDHTGRRLFWTDNYAIWSMKLDGTDRKEEISHPINKFRDVAVYNAYMAWTDGDSSVLFGVLGNTEPARGLTHHRTSNVSHDIIAYSSHNQPLLASKCDDANGECDQLCIPLANGERSCRCAFGFRLYRETRCLSDLTTKDFLLFSDPYHKQVYQLPISKIDRDVTNYGELPELHARALKTAEFPHKFDFDPEEGVIYWVDTHARVIKHTHLIHDVDDTTVILSETAEITALALAVESRLLFFADSNTESIHVFDLKSESQTAEPMEFQTNVHVNTMVVHVEETGASWLYWTHEAVTGEGSTGIYRSDINDKRNVMEIFTSTQPITGLTVDTFRGELVWCTATSIYMSDMEGNEYKELYSDSNAKFSNVAALSQYYLVTHHNQKAVFQIDKDTLQHQQNVTEGIFARITDMKIDMKTENHFTSKDPTGANTPGASGGLSLELLMVVVGSVVFFCVILLVIGLLVWRCRREPQIPTMKAEEEHAHDNPTYMTTVPQPAPEPIYHTLAGATGGNRDSDLPDIVMSKEGYPLPPDNEKKVPLEGPVVAAYDDVEVSKSDKEQLVDEAVVMDMDSKEPRVTFKN